MTNGASPAPGARNRSGHAGACHSANRFDASAVNAASVFARAHFSAAFAMAECLPHSEGASAKSAMVTAPRQGDAGQAQPAPISFPKCLLLRCPFLLRINSHIDSQPCLAHRSLHQLAHRPRRARSSKVHLCKKEPGVAPCIVELLRHWTDARRTDGRTDGRTESTTEKQMEIQTCIH